MLKGLFVLEIVKLSLSLLEEGLMIQLNWALEPDGEVEYVWAG